jgi:pimeloyl-ACP methyl ester carboxylesterase
VTRFLDATRERFLLAIAASLPAERFIELHFFPAIRQGGVESGVAVIAAHPERVEAIVVADTPPEEGHSERSEESALPPIEPDVLAPESDPASASIRSFASLRMTADRYTVYSAKYRLVLKGPDRSKWECSVVAEADAPLVTVETVVRGVQRRSGDAEDPERMSGDDARNFVLAATR